MKSLLRRRFGRRGSSGGRGDFGRALIRRADAARDEGRWLAAACLYEEAAIALPDHGGIAVQAGHMFKEARMFARAEAHYLRARDMMPDDADLWFQLAHFYKLTERPGEALPAFRRALALQPGWAEPAREVAALAAGPGSGGADDPPAAAAVQDPGAGRIAPALAPRSPEELPRFYEDAIHVARCGQREAGPWGIRPTLRGVSAVRGHVVSAVPVSEVALLVDDAVMHRGGVQGGYPLRLDAAPGVRLKYVFNIWVDLAGIAPGQHRLELRFALADGTMRGWQERIVVAPALPEAASPDSDALVEIDRADPRGVEAQVRARPSMIRPARRAVFPDGVRSVLVQRTDQLGDIIASIPALRRLRELVPDARIVGLLTAANAAFAHTLPLFDEVIVVDFPDDPVERRRIMSVPDQVALRNRLAPYRFDLALDLASSDVSRDLLQLSGARFIYGVGGGDWPYLDAEFILNTHDRWTRMDVIPHAAKVRAMIEALAPMLGSGAPVIPPAHLDRGWLAAYGIGADERYILLHAGARVVFSRWPHYAALARMLLAETGYRIVMMSEDAGVRETLPADLLADARFTFLGLRLPFDHFDAFVSFAQAVVGNDSGPKHLAALRGTNVVTLFTARINWMEWGQEEIGRIISRRVPCAGCAIFHDQEECGQGFTCIADIAPREVFDALADYL